MMRSPTKKKFNNTYIKEMPIFMRDLQMRFRVCRRYALQENALYLFEQNYYNPKNAGGQ